MDQTNALHPPQRRRRLAGLARAWLRGAALVLLVTIVYLPTLDNGFFYDDRIDIQENLSMRSLAGLADIWLKFGTFEQYYPLMYTTHWVEYQLWGPDPRGYHAVNLLLHAASVVLIWRLLMRLDVPGSWLAAAIFAVHPVGVESAAWVTERRNVLSCALGMGSLLAYLRFSPPEGRRREGGQKDEGRRMTDEKSGFRASSFILHPSSFPYYALALALYIAALLAKTATAALPAVLLVIYWWKRGRVTWRDVIPTLPFFAVGLALCGITVVMENALGTPGTGGGYSPADRLLIAGRALWFYAGKLLWPSRLVWFYPRWVIDSHVWWQYLFPAATLAVLALLWFARKSVGRGPLAAVLIFAGVLVPVIGFFDVFMFRFTFVADHLQYHASIALMALAAAAAALVAARLNVPARWLAPVAGAALLLPLSVVARHRTYVWKDNVTVWQDAARTDPHSWMAHRSLGFHFENQGNYDQALTYLHKATAIREEQLRDNPTFSQYADDLATSLLDAGALQHDFGRPAEAEQSIRKAIEIRRRLVDDHPGVADYQDGLSRCYICLAAAQQKMGRADDAIASQRNAIEIRAQLARDYPAISRYENNVAASYLDLGTLQRTLGHLAEADGARRTAIDIREKLARDNPTIAEYQAELAECYEEHAVLQREDGQTEDALASRQKAIGVREKLLGDKDHMTVAKRMTLIEVRQNLAQDDRALSKYRDDLAGGYVDLGLLERELGRLAEAQNSFRRAIEIREELVRDYPAAAEYQDGLAWCYVDLALAQRESGATGDALASHRKAIEVRDQLVRNNPQNGKYQNNLAASFVDLGLSQRAAGQPAQAENALRKAIKIRDALVRDHPAATEYRDGLAWCYVYLVVAQFEAGRLADAERSCRQAIQIREKLVQDNPTADGYQQQLALSFRDLGNLQRAAGQIGDAAASYHRAIEIRQKLLRDDPADAARQSTLAADLALEGDAQASLSNWSGSAEAYAQAVQRGDSSWPTLERLALVQLAAGDEAAYRSTCADLIKRHADDAAADAALAMALTVVMGENALPDMNQALALAQRAAEADPMNPLPQVAVGAAQYRAGHVPEAIGTLTDALWRFNSAPRSAPATTPQTFLGRLLGEMFLALAYREQADSEALPPQLAALRTWIDQAETPAPPAPAGLPPWTLRCAVALAKRELAKLDPPNERSGRH